MIMSSRQRRRAVRTSPPAAEHRPPAHDLGVLLTLALEAFKERLHAHLARAGYDDLGPSFGFVFRSLADRPLSLVELAARLGISSQGALKIVTEMEGRGYVERQDDATDRRVRRLALTSRGRSALREARRLHAAVERELTAAFGAERVAGARVVLEALAGEAAHDSTSWAKAARPF
jgi:DNA-binding MarR family transcriptional regulator